MASGPKTTDSSVTRVLLNVDALKRRRMELGLTIIAVGEAANLKRSTIYKALRTGECGVGAAGRIAQALKLELADLWLDAQTLRPWRPQDGQ